MLKITIASVRAHKRRLTSMFVSVFLGVAFLAGTLVLGDTLQKNFDNLFGEVNAGTDVVVRRTSQIDSDFETANRVMDASVAKRVAAVDGVADAAPYIEGFGRILGKDGKALGGDGPPTLAGSWVDDPDLNPYRIAEGRAPEGPDEVVINRGAAEDGKLGIGDRTIVQTPDPVHVTIVGITTFGDADGLGGVTMAHFSLDAAQRHIIKGRGEVTSVLARAEPGVSQEELVRRVTPVLPSGIEAISGTERTAQDIQSIGEDFLNFFKTFLVIFAVIALLVASFSIHNTFSILVSQRTRESALLRTVGASRGQILSWVTVEALVLGAIASIAGLGGGVLLAGLLKGLFDSFGFTLPAGGLEFKSSTAVISLAIGIGVTLIAGMGPALKAARVAPLAALRDVSVDRSGVSLLRSLAGAVLLVAGVGLVTSTVIAEGEIALAGLGALLTIAGVAVFGPVIARPASRIIGAPLARARGITGVLARRNAMRNPRRTAGTASALMVGVGVVTLFTVFAASLKQSVNEVVASSVRGDLVISAGQFGGGGLSPALAPDIAKLDKVAGAVGVGVGAALIDGKSRVLTVVDPAAVTGVLDLDVKKGSLAALGTDHLAVSKKAADDHHWTLGTPLPVRFGDGSSATLRLGAIYGAADIAGDYVMPRPVWESHVAQSIDSTVFVRLASGVGIDDGRAAVQTVARRYGAPDVQSKAEYVADATSNVNQVLGLIYVMLFLAIVIALMGIANTLALAVSERTGELGIMRAVGTTRAQVRSMVRWEAVIVSLFGTLSGIGVGVFLGWALFHVAAARQGFTGFAIPVSQLVVVVAVGAVAGVLAGLRPARRAARLDVLRAVATT